MHGQLVPCGGGRPIVLVKTKLLVGRQSGCDIALPLPNVSSRHCELEFQDGYWNLRDLASKNGTWVNGALWEAGQLLPHDILTVASYRFMIVYPLPPGVLPSADTAIPDITGPAARPAAAVAFGQLVPCGGGDPIPLRQTRILVGRSEDCDVVLPCGTVSGRHCELTWTDQGWSVRDLGSRNGVRVDGIRCEQKLLPPGSILALAEQRFEVTYDHKVAAQAVAQLV
jgi:pSer/pThr/pTyr-binding forkhead associated (FHA) protein